MRILVVWPPHVPSYFNAGHHLPVFTVAAYLRERFPEDEVDALDAGALNVTWKDFGRLLWERRFDAVVVWNEYDVVEGVRRAVDYVRALLPGAATATIGRLSYEAPDYFLTLPFDAVAVAGDYESAAAAFLSWVKQGRPAAAAEGLHLRAGGTWTAPLPVTGQLPPEEWVLPEVDEIPYDAYEALYRDDRNRFCGIPGMGELVVPVARGCPVGCAYCDVPRMQGLRERRLSVGRTVDYIVDSFARRPFDYVSFYAPTFTLRRPWVVELCERFRREPRRYPWKCATTLHHLDPDLLALMGASGCVRVSVGVETLETADDLELPRLKRNTDTLADVADACRAAGIELNCFVIVGLPGTTVDGTRRTVERLRELGARVRPTLYTPYQQMRGAVTERELSAFNRQTFVDTAHLEALGIDPLDLLGYVHGRDDYETSAPDLVTHVVRSG